MSRSHLRKIPKDGPGPRGAPDCYYTSRVLNSTFRYEKFVRKLRALEEEQRIGDENKLKKLKDKQISDFFISCDRRLLINNVARRVDLCMASYQEDLKQKRRRLIDLYTNEEQENIRLFVIQAQSGAEMAWQDKVDRLRYLLEKRRKEHEEKYKKPPLSKSVKVLSSIAKLRAKETEEIQLYQIKEKQARQMAMKEFDRMWHEVAMKESDALAARMEQDAIELARKEHEAKMFTDEQVELRRIQREKDKEMLKEEAKRFKAIWDADIEKENEVQRQKADMRKATAVERKKMIIEKQERLAKELEKERLVSDTWASLTNQGLADIQAKLDLRKRKERELDECNKQLLEMRNKYEHIDKCIDICIVEEAQKRQDQMDRNRCEYSTKHAIRTHNTSEEVHKGLLDQIKDREQAREILKQKIDEEDEFKRQQIRELNKKALIKELTEAEARKMHQNDLREQMKEKQLLMEQAKQEESLQFKKSDAIREEQEVNQLMARLFAGNAVHPFMKQIAGGLTMREKCPCSRPDYCK